MNKNWSRHKRLEYLRKRRWEAIANKSGYWPLFFPELNALNERFAMKQFLGAFRYLGKHVFVRNATDASGGTYTGKILVTEIERSPSPEKALVTLHGFAIRCPLAPQHAPTKLSLAVSAETQLACGTTKQLR